MYGSGYSGSTDGGVGYDGHIDDDSSSTMSRGLSYPSAASRNSHRRRLFPSGQVYRPSNTDISSPSSSALYWNGDPSCGTGYGSNNDVGYDGHTSSPSSSWFPDNSGGNDDYERNESTSSSYWNTTAVPRLPDKDRTRQQGRRTIISQYGTNDDDQELTASRAPTITTTNKNKKSNYFYNNYRDDDDVVIYSYGPGYDGHEDGYPAS